MFASADNGGSVSRGEALLLCSILVLFLNCRGNYSIVRKILLKQMKKRCFLTIKNINSRTSPNLEKFLFKNSTKHRACAFLHSLGVEYCRVVRDNEPIKSLKTPRSLSVHILIYDIIFIIVQNCHKLQ